MNDESILVTVHQTIVERDEQEKANELSDFKNQIPSAWRDARTNLPIGRKSKRKDEEYAGNERPEFWLALAKWAKDHDQLSPFERYFAFNIGLLLSRGRTPSQKQAKLVAKIREQYINQGFNKVVQVIRTN